MKNVRKPLIYIWAAVASIFLFFNTKSIGKDNDLIDRINSVRRNVKNKVQAGEVDVLKNFNVSDFLVNSWGNWGNWGNWNNWNNWAKWNDWNNWRNWGNWGNW